MQFYKQRVILWVASGLVFITPLSFRTMTKGNPWPISRDDPVLYLKICEEANDQTFEDYNIEDGDPFGAENLSTVRELVTTVVQDVNAMSTIFLRIEIVPRDGDPLSEGATYSTERAKDRTIEFCTYDYDVGSARPDWSGSKMKGCKILIGGFDSEKAKEFTGLFGHELGHCLGLTHAQDTENALVSYFQKNGIRFNTDDKIGLTYLYPASHVENVEPTFGLSCTTK